MERVSLKICTNKPRNLNQFNKVAHNRTRVLSALSTRAHVFTKTQWIMDDSEKFEGNKTMQRLLQTRALQPWSWCSDVQNSMWQMNCIGFNHAGTFFISYTEIISLFSLNKKSFTLCFIYSWHFFWPWMLQLLLIVNPVNFRTDDGWIIHLWISEKSFLIFGHEPQKQGKSSHMCVVCKLCHFQTRRIVSCDCSKMSCWKSVKLHSSVVRILGSLKEPVTVFWWGLGTKKEQTLVCRASEDGGGCSRLRLWFEQL